MSPIPVIPSYRRPLVARLETRRAKQVQSLLPIRFTKALFSVGSFSAGPRMRVSSIAVVSLWLVLPISVRAGDSDGDGIPDGLDVCPGTPAGVVVDSFGRPAADFNQDCALNGLDLDGFIGQLLATPGGIAPTTHELLSPTAEPSGYFGISVAGVPDADGDGLTDIIVGAKLENPVGSPNDAGRAHLFSGATGQLIRTYASPNEESDGRFGWGVGGIPDVNGDGRGDVIIGAPLENPGGSMPDSGRAYIFSGATGELLETLNSPIGPQGALFGYSVAGLSDIDSDGRGDVVIGAWHESEPGHPGDAGRAHVFSGDSGELLFTLVSPNETVGGYFGVAVGGVPDTNADGVDDIVVGAPGDEEAGPFLAGRAYVFSGQSGALLRTLVSGNEQPLGNFGGSVGGIPDVNGDEIGDLIIGASQETAEKGPDFAGRAYILSGDTGEVLHELVSPNELEFGTFGNAVAGVADLDGDGRGDVIVGASYEGGSPSPDGRGKAYVVSGATGLLITELDSPQPDPAGAFGFAVAGLTDASGDGRGDVAISGLFDNPVSTPTDCGAMYRFNLMDSDTDSVPDSIDVCPGTPSGMPVDRNGRPAADANGDCLVSAQDIGGFVATLLTP